MGAGEWGEEEEEKEEEEVRGNDNGNATRKRIHRKVRMLRLDKSA